MRVQEAFESLLLSYKGTPQEASGWAKEVGWLYGKHIAPTFAAKSLKSLKRSQIRRWHAGIPGVPGNRALSVLSKIFMHALEDSDEIPFNPCTGVKRHREKARERYADPAELQKLVPLLDSSVQGIFIRSLLLTGARPSTLEKLMWAHVDGLRVFIEGKTGTDKITLTAELVELWRSLPRRLDGKVFGIKMPRKYWLRTCEKAGISGLWARDLRRTFASIAVSNGVSMDTVGSMLNHKKVQTTKRYALTLSKTAEESAVKIGDAIERLAG
jgi:integrase